VRSTVGELLLERLRLTQPWYRVSRSGRRARIWTEKVSAVLGTTITRNSTIENLTQLQRAVTLAAVALAERTPVVVLDSRERFASPEDEAAFIRAVDHLAPESTTIVLGRPVSRHPITAADVRRTITSVDLTPHSESNRPAQHERRGALS
jgi:RND superfamily putative drug exporter